MNATQNKPEADRVYPAELKVILDRARAGDTTVLTELQAALKQFPELIGSLGNLADHVEQAFLGLLTGNNLLAQEAIRQQLQALKQDLGLDESSPLERLLVKRVGLTWLQVHQADIEVAGKLQRGQAASAALAFAQKRQQQSHARFLAAVKTLALVRKLLRPAPSPIAIATRLKGHGDVPDALKARVEGLCPAGN